LRDYGTAKWEGGNTSCNHYKDSKLKNANTGQREVSLGIGDGIYKDICPKCGAKRIDSQLGLEKTPEEYVAKMVDVFREVRRVLRDDGTLWLNLGDSYFTSGGGNKSGGSGSFDGHVRRADRPACEYRTGHKTLKSKDLVGIPWMVAFALRADGWYLRQDIIWSKPNPMPESVTDRCTKAHEYIFLLSKSQKYYYDAEAIKEPYQQSSLEQCKYPVAKHAIDESGGSFGKGIRGNPDRGMIIEPKEGGRNKCSVWNIATKSFSEAHFATFPQDLIKPCILAGCPDRGLVLDCFMGSGTTALVAKNLNRKYIGIELNPDYVKLAEKRLSQQRLEL
jgi:DNA modification methylase